MSNAEIFRPRSAEGVQLDATFEIEALCAFDVVYHHKAGARGSQHSVNADYHAGLELLLARLGQLQMTILGIWVDSGIARKLPPADRQLDLRFPIRVDSHTNHHELRLLITRAQKSVARRANAKPNGGNDQKRIRITVCSDKKRLSRDALVAVLLNGHDA
jgi:hypothetical protein